MSGGWNHNIRYHGVVLDWIASNFGARAMWDAAGACLCAGFRRDVRRFVALDIDHAALVSARTMGAGEGRIAFVEGDVMALITAVATLHHLPLTSAWRVSAARLDSAPLAYIPSYRGFSSGAASCSDTR